MTVIKEIYKDAASPAVQEVGKVGGRTAKLLLFPIRGLLWGWEQIEEMVENGLSERLKGIPNEQLKTPNPEIAVPLIQALTYTAQNETLREMYLNLLANSMNSCQEDSVHPSFVETIKQMNTLDAKLFKKLSENFEYKKAINPDIEIVDTDQVLIGVVPKWYIGLKLDDYNEFQISTSLIRLDKFGLIDLFFNTPVLKGDYDSLKNCNFLKNILIVEQKKRDEDRLKIVVNKGALEINEYGKQFKEACL